MGGGVRSGGGDGAIIFSCYFSSFWIERRKKQLRLLSVQQKVNAIREAVIALATAAAAPAPKNSKPAGKTDKKEAGVLGNMCSLNNFCHFATQNTSGLFFVCFVAVRMCFVLVISSFSPYRLFKYPIFNSLCKQFTYSSNSVHSIGLFVVLPFRLVCFTSVVIVIFSYVCLHRERDENNI